MFFSNVALMPQSSNLVLIVCHRCQWLCLQFLYYGTAQCDRFGQKVAFWASFLAIGSLQIDLLVKYECLKMAQFCLGKCSVIEDF